jgi:hypothetical protein
LAGFYFFCSPPALGRGLHFLFSVHSGFEDKCAVACVRMLGGAGREKEQRFPSVEAKGPCIFREILWRFELERRVVADGGFVDQPAGKSGGTLLGHQRHNIRGGYDGERDLGSKQLLEH